ncbi:MAG: cyclase family protein [candidate division Zixibacteria bacterium]|nr:cyclase family protein [candidate division Zixibacteria bacterium]
MSRVIDISQKLDMGIAVWPGDTQFRTFWVMRMDRGDACNVGSVTMSLHTGTHADAPLHFLERGGASVDSDLTAYIGPALVVDIRGADAVQTEHVAPLAALHPERVLFRTGTVTPDRFNSGFAYVSAEAARALVQLKIRLVGMDTPSMDQSDSKTLDAHKIFAAANVALLENLDLADVAPGTYELIALPLKLAGMDASPVRAILRTIERQ